MHCDAEKERVDTEMRQAALANEQLEAEEEERNRKFDERTE
jgi:hypothetical protein